MQINVELVELDPENIELVGSAEGTSLIYNAGSPAMGIKLVRLLPFADPDHYWGVLDHEGNDLGVIADPSRLPAKSKLVADQMLSERYFMPEAHKVVSVRDDFGTQIWNIETAQGNREYAIRNLKDNLLGLPPHRVILTDADGNRFEIPNSEALSPKAAEMLARGQ